MQLIRLSGKAYIVFPIFKRICEILGDICLEQLDIVGDIALEDLEYQLNNYCKERGNCNG